ncbi:MAG: DEAD/DEAH box helicase [Prevotellaceae bacterium]|jgi:superfamily II DNA/RNA helicase|nr:DEAD/DEAH box helicase [Prevotellaceae bacterium]
MQAFKNHSLIMNDYRKFLRSFLNISDERIKNKVEEELNNNSYLPEPLIQFNPSYKTGLSIEDLSNTGVIHPDLKKILGAINLYHHQVEAIKRGTNGEGFIVTSGTGSGKSLTFLATIFNDIITNGAGDGVKAIIVYPMNALINSQEEEIKKYEINYLKSQLFDSNTEPSNIGGSLDEQIAALKKQTNASFPITYAKYTGQENANIKQQIRDGRPNIILTNYMMLELIMTRYEEKSLREAMAKTLKFLVFDELHTYRGRQGADVTMLIRRIKNLCSNRIISIGTSATMSSEGNVDDRKKAIADIANLIFEEKYTLSQIIDEKLETSTQYAGRIPTASEINDILTNPIHLSDDATQFRNHPLAIWLECSIALKIENEELERGIPSTLSEISQKLSVYIEKDEEICRKTILRLLEWIEQLNNDGYKQNPHKSYLPFKLHQFISQTGTVRVTLGTKRNRHITLDDNPSVKLSGKETPLYPVLFSRYSGYDFICVKLIEGKILPRDPDSIDDLPPRITQDDIKADKRIGKLKKLLKFEDFPYGYLIPQDEGEENIWDEENTAYLPDSWFTETLRDGRKIKNSHEHRLPRLLYYDNAGHFSWTSANQFPLKAWYIPADLLFDPTSGIIFDLKTNENTKLSRLGNEGRSSSTTVLGATILKTLHENNIPTENRKFLSFTDNRQDASLQSGHFNDFFTIARLRSAIYQAVKNHPEGLDCNQIHLEVLRHLNLSESEYARNVSTNPGWTDEKNIKAIQKYVLIRILYDLKLGWRYTTPNLEQTALIQIKYDRLDEFCRHDNFFEKVGWIKTMPPQERETLFVQILNYFRTSFAFDHIYIVEKRDEVESELKQMLDENKLWSLNNNEKIEIPYLLLPYSIGKAKTREYTASIGPMSHLGKYIKRIIKKKTEKIIGRDDLSKEIDTICEILKGGNFLTQVPIKANGENINGYRIRMDHIVWQLGDEKNVLQDDVRLIKYKHITTTPNIYFQEFYKQDFQSDHQNIEGKEHTGQLSNEDRINREEAFREGKLAALFCSPTMELGIDISQLNIVHMRNVPPRPDNYAQRSGRAGRSGQSALVYTFCSKGSPHDRNYFKNAKKMVHGVVVPPKIDITNEELIRSHLDAFIMMELGINIKSSVREIIDINDPALPISNSIKIKIEEIQKHYSLQWAKQFNGIIQNIEKLTDTNWFGENWLIDQIQSYYNRFDEAFKRWRLLYINTIHTLEKAHLIISTPNHPKIKDAKRMQAIALRQRDLLLNEKDVLFGNESEFYIFRYLASEGFLPGYNFTRLPVRVFVGNSKALQQGEYISRPRFIALTEFGPNNLIYHNGSKYRIVKMQLNQGGELMQTLKISKETGYAFVGSEATAVNNDPITNRELKGDDAVEFYNNAIELNESEARIEERISCNEEIRVLQGYDIDHFFSFSEGIENTQKAMIRFAEDDLLQLIYDQSATLIQVNNRWKVTKDETFPIGKISGIWKTRNEEQPNPDDPVENVRIYATTTSDILYIQPVKELQLKEIGVCTLAFALKQAIENEYQVEEREIGVWIMGKTKSKNILIYESSEGSLGILKDLLNNTAQLRKIFEKAYILLGFNPDNQTDTRPDTPKASYDDLLSYYNQQYHDKLDRFSVKEALEKLMHCTVDNQQGGRRLEEQYNYLLNKYDLNSATEKPFIEYLYKNGHKLPDEAQVNIPNLYVSADFVYKLSEKQFALVFCDGSVHDADEIKKTDKTKRQHCRDAGYEVLVWHYSEPIEEFINRNKHVFRIVR